MAAARPLGALQWAVIALAAATGFIHIVLAFQFVPGPDVTFVLNGVGYFGLVALLYLPVPGVQKYHSWVGWVLIVYTAITIVAWARLGVGSPLAGMPIDLSSPTTWVAYADKLIEVVLIILVWMDLQQGRDA